MERRRLQALAEAHAPFEIQRVWRGSRGRSAARRRLATIALARTMVGSFTEPAGFAAANLSAFNYHGGFLGSAGIDARSLLAAATGGDQGPGAVAVTTAGERVAGKGGKMLEEEGDDSIWLRLRRSMGYYGTFSSEAVAGIAEIGIRVCLRRCQSHVECPAHASTPQWSLEQSSLGTGRAGGGSGFGDGLSTPWIERDRNTTSNRQSPESGNVPLTLKLELISIQDGAHGTFKLNRSGIYVPQTIDVRTECADNDDSNPSLARAGSNSDNGARGCDCKSINETCSTNTRRSVGSGSSSRHKVGEPLGRRGTDSSDPENFENQCEVSWCGGSVGSTRAPLAGFPLPRWEGQVFYLPLRAAASRDDPPTAAAAAAAVGAGSKKLKDEPNDAHRIADNSSRWGQESESSGRRVEAGGGKKGERELSPLLSVTLNRISGKRRSRYSCNGACRDGAYFSDPGVTGRVSLPWAAYLSGEIEPTAVGRVILGAGDVLSMLGSQQVRRG